MTEVQYRDFSLEFHQRMGKKRKPIVGQMELTFRCNLKCVHCYIPYCSRSIYGANMPDKSGNYCSRSIHGAEELSYSEIIDILNQIQKEGCLWLSFTGGEPLMRKDFLDIYGYAKRKGFLITILTNGTLITKKIADHLAKEPPFSIDITLNGITEETYEIISQVKGSFKKVMEGINLLLERNLPLKIKTQVTKLNYHELDKIKEFIEGLGVKFQPSGILYPKLNGSQEPCSYRLSSEEMINLDRFYPDGEDCEEKPVKKIPPSDRLFRCAAGISSFHISPYGELIFCTFLRQPNFDLRKGSFKQGFYNLYPEIRKRKYQTNSKCKDCRISYLCSQCPALAYLEKGDYEKPIDYFCQLAHKIVIARRSRGNLEIASPR